MKKIKVKELKFKKYFIIEDAIEQGMNIGFDRAHKHVENPSPDTIKENILREITNKLDEIINFEE